MNKSLTLQHVASLSSIAHVSMNFELLELGSGVFYLRGTMIKRVLTAIVSPSSTPDCVAIQYEQSGHFQLYPDCSLDHLMFPMLGAPSSLCASWAVRAMALFLSKANGLLGGECGQLQPSAPKG